LATGVRDLLFSPVLGFAFPSLKGFPIDLIPATYDLTKQAAEFHSRHPLPYADCFAAALTADRQATLATSDKHFARVTSHLRLLWTTNPKTKPRRPPSPFPRRCHPELRSPASWRLG